MNEELVPVFIQEASGDVIAFMLQNSLTLSSFTDDSNILFNADHNTAQNFASYMMVRGDAPAGCSTDALDREGIAAFIRCPHKRVMLSNHNEWALFGRKTDITKVITSFLSAALEKLPQNHIGSITVTDCVRALGLPKLGVAYRFKVNDL